MKEYRCTRNQPYQGVACPGNLNTRARQGHYIIAHNEHEALMIMGNKFPNDKMGFTAELWKDESRVRVAP